MTCSVKACPSQQELQSVFRYDPATGKLFWKHRAGNTKFNARYGGQEAFTAFTRNGYKHGRFKQIDYFAHRIIWKLVHGVDPEFIDHINHDRADNRIGNLRSVSKRENCKNVSLGSKNTSGRVGVVWFSARNNWKATIKVEGRQMSLGYFASYEEAVSARKDAEAHFGFHENHGAKNAA